MCTLNQLAAPLFGEWKDIITQTPEALVIQQVLESGDLELITKLEPRQVKPILVHMNFRGQYDNNLIKAVHKLVETDDFKDESSEEEPYTYDDPSIDDRNAEGFDGWTIHGRLVRQS